VITKDKLGPRIQALDKKLG